MVHSFGAGVAATLDGYFKEGRKKNVDKVYFTDSLLSAQKYAVKAAEKYGGTPVVYEVKPVGEYINCNTNEYIADKARVIRIVAVYNNGWN